MRMLTAILVVLVSVLVIPQTVEAQTASDRAAIAEMARSMDELIQAHCDNNTTSSYGWRMCVERGQMAALAITMFTVQEGAGGGEADTFGVCARERLSHRGLDFVSVRRCMERRLNVRIPNVDIDR